MDEWDSSTASLIVPIWGTMAINYDVICYRIFAELATVITLKVLGEGQIGWDAGQTPQVLRMSRPYLATMLCTV
jgi:hypothetical protein